MLSSIPHLVHLSRTLTLAIQNPSGKNPSATWGNLKVTWSGERGEKMTPGRAKSPSECLREVLVQDISHQPCAIYHRCDPCRADDREWGREASFS